MLTWIFFRCSSATQTIAAAGVTEGDRIMVVCPQGTPAELGDVCLNDLPSWTEEDEVILVVTGGPLTQTVALAAKLVAETTYAYWDKSEYGPSSVTLIDLLPGGGTVELGSY